MVCNKHAALLIMCNHGTYVKVCYMLHIQLDYDGPTNILFAHVMNFFWMG